MAEDLVVQERDETRLAFLKSAGYKVIPIWECAIEKNPEKIQNRLRKLSSQV
jgi:G:T-mismatch repair DNA endonuclease (very short patch repair protein)